jgi:hypothetical protein
MVNTCYENECGLGRLRLAFDRHLEPEGFQVPDEPLRVRLDTPPLADVFSQVYLACAP